MVCNVIEFVFLMDKYPNHNIKVKEDEKMETCFLQLNELIKKIAERGKLKFWVLSNCWLTDYF